MLFKCTVWILLLGWANCQDACSLKCGPRENTLCSFCEDIRAETCDSDVVKYGVTEKDRIVILSAHNEFRRAAAKGEEEFVKTGNKAARMYELAWNTDLAILAQKWADQCTTVNDDCRRTPDFENVGQNIARMTDTGASSFEDLIGKWEEEGETIDYEANRDNRKNINEYSQMIWAKTTHIGCGYIATRKCTDCKVTSYLVCNYGPAGNDAAEIFGIGDPVCVECNTNKGEVCSDGLCQCSSQTCMKDNESKFTDSKCGNKENKDRKEHKEVKPYSGSSRTLSSFSLTSLYFLYWIYHQSLQ